MDEVICHRVGTRDIASALDGLLGEAGGRGWLEGLQKDRVVIKPNLCYFASHRYGITTDPLLVEHLIGYIREIRPRCEISLVESDGSDRRLDEVCERLGYTELADRLGVELVNVSQARQVEIRPRELPFTLSVPELFFQDLFFISVAQLKTHHYQRITCCLKNQFGCLPTPRKRELHPYLEEVIYVINKVAAPDLCIVDGRVGLEGMGPVSGNPRQVGLLVAGRDPLTTDIACAHIMGFGPRQVPAIAYALERDGLKAPRPNIEQGLVSRFRSISAPEYRLLRSKIKVTRLANQAERRIKDLLTLPYRVIAAVPEGAVKRYMVRSLSSNLRVR